MKMVFGKWMLSVMRGGWKQTEEGPRIIHNGGTCVRLALQLSC